jgi:xylulokinase
MMAAVGVGAYPTLAGAVTRMSRIERVFAPNPRRKARYDALFEAYQRATEALKPLGRLASSQAGKSVPDQ